MNKFFSYTFILTIFLGIMNEDVADALTPKVKRENKLNANCVVDLSGSIQSDRKIFENVSLNGLPGNQMFDATSRLDTKTETDKAICQAHSELWNNRIDKNGIMLDFVGEIPGPEDCILGRPNAIGWWSPIENGPFFTGLYLSAMCGRAKRTKDPVDKANAQRLVMGLIKCASVSDVSGFIARGVGTDGKCHYPLGSDDQTHPWFYGLYEYLQSDLPSHKERKMIVNKMTEVANALQNFSWKCPCDGAFKGQFRGSFQGHLFRDAVRYLFILRAMYDVTRDAVWLQRYQKALIEKPEGCNKTRIEICSLGYIQDSEAIKNIDDYQQWIYVGSQGSLAKLITLEPDASLVAKYHMGLIANTEKSLISLGSYKLFDNNDTKVFGNREWRKGYPVWFPQATQKDAGSLSAMGNKAILGERKHYESSYVRNPLAAAAIIALKGDGTGYNAIREAIRHYDYSKINISEFFFAECAYYALPILNQAD